MAETKELQGKVALVTGGSRGIGKAISLRLAELGADVIINYFRKKSTANETAEAVRVLGVNAHTIKANIGEPEQIDAMFVEIKEKFGHIDILISNAASGVARPAMDLTVEGWDWTMNINARACLLCAQKAAGLMTKGGKIVAISSLGSQLVMPVYTSVGVSKAALEALVRYLAIELAPKNIAVNGISAHAVATEALKIYASAGMVDSKLLSTPMGRAVEPEDVANVVSFLCGERSTMIRGQIIVIDGGFTIAPMMGSQK